jgi:hypothetical protein
MDESTEPVSDDRPVVRGPFRSPGLGTRIEEYERRGTEDFLAGEYHRPAATCSTCRVPREHCLCHAEPDRLRYALAQISLVHQLRPDGSCAGCRAQAVLCGYITLLDYVRG